MTKYTYLISLAWWICSHEAFSQAPTDNYIKVYRALKSTSANLTILEDKDSITEVITYFDGLGREVQSVARQASPLGKDVVTVSAYDGYGKTSVSFLPYVSDQTTGAPKASPLTDQATFYTTLFGSIDGASAFSTSVLEHSELARVLIQSSPGDAWKLSGSHVIRKEYSIAGEDVVRFQYDSLSGSVSLISPPADMFFGSTQLTCTKTIDEHLNDVLEYVDTEGRTVCKKVKAPGGVYASTYYVYDAFGNLVIVIPPEGVQRILDPN